jgi:L-threonylcarbamoyladenylate synthase
MIVPDNQTTHERAVAIIRAGGVIAFRTDTFYGLGADPFNARALQHIAELKGREGKPILVVISDRGQVERFVARQTSAFTTAADAFWPGPITLVAPAVAALPTELTAGGELIGLRFPADENLTTFVRLCGGALTATSANLTGSPPAESAQQVEEYFGESVDLIIDGGTTQASQASTVLDVSQAKPRIVREGMVSRATLEEVLGSLAD